MYDSTDCLSSAKRAVWFVGALVLGALASGCGHDYWARFELLSAPPEATIEHDRIQLRAGIAAGVRAIAMQDDERLDDEDDPIQIGITSLQANVFGVDRGIEDNTFVFYGVKPGTTSIDVYFDENFVDNVPVTVLEP